MALLSDAGDNWIFLDGFENSFPECLQPGEIVEIPHNAVDLPFEYFDETAYQRVFTYQKHIPWQPEFAGKEVSLVFDGAMANATVYLGGEQVANHKDGYSPFEVRLTNHLGVDGILVTVTVDGSENPEIPPFGGRIDYLTYAGIYREVWLKITDCLSIANFKAETHDVLADTKRLSVRCFPANPRALPIEGTWTAELLAPDGAILAKASAIATGAPSQIELDDLTGIALWDLDSPTLYTLRINLDTDKSSDQMIREIGFRSAEFTPEGFELNGRLLKLMGLNRHQSFPYSGYAQGRASQEQDAEILKNTLACNIVRTSHYPQSTWFLNHCDRIGLLVLEEIPGWQHLGGDVWKDETVRNVARMIERDWNHPSIVLWGVRINESPDDDAFYERTNAKARALDTTRQTGGIRKHTESTLLEDVYTFNDFILGEFEMPGSNRPRTALRDQNEVTGLQHNVPYLVTEYNGHMYPTKVYDQEQRQVEHVTRHLDILNAAHGNPSISGCIGWCMFDYHTHADFGSGDRICHHGVLTMFREPKFAAYAYASQGNPDKKVVMQPVTYWARGERNIGGTLPLMVLSNCDFIRMNFVAGGSIDIHPDRLTYPHLPHPPMMLRHEDITGEQLGRWGMQWHDVELVGYIKGEVAVKRTLVANPLPSNLELCADRIELNAEQRETRVIVRALDQAGNILPFLHDSADISISGPAQLIGPSKSPLRGGSTGFWVRAHGIPGAISINVRTERFDAESVKLMFR